jgi:TetR/AcrR family transcriptional regulator, tetracycline repressor protein
VTTPRKKDLPVPLSRDRILQEALALVDEEGLEALTMRALGGRLGVEAMALYHHFPGKDALLDGLMERLLAQVQVPGAGPWRRRLEAAAGSYREVALAHPKAFILVLTRPYLTETLLRFCDRLLQIFLDAGFSPEAAARAFRLLGHFLDGATLYISQGPAAAHAPPPAPVDPERFPSLAACRPHLARRLAEKQFAFGLDRLLADLDRQAKEGRKGRR